MLNLDTHVVLHALAGNLRPVEQRLLEGDAWSMSAIVLWEICKLRELGRVDVDLEAPEVVQALGRIHTWPITLEICRTSCDLGLGGDPADQLIAATSVVHRVPLLTRDRLLRKSKQVPLAAL